MKARSLRLFLLVHNPCAIPCPASLVHCPCLPVKNKRAAYTPSTGVNTQSLQLKLGIVFNLKNNKIRQVFEWYNGYDISNAYIINNKWKANYLGCIFTVEQVWTWVSHLQTRDSNKLSHVSGYAPTRFDLGSGCAPMGPPTPPKIANGWSIFKHGTVLYCWAELCSRSIPPFHIWEQHTAD